MWGILCILSFPWILKIVFKPVKCLKGSFGLQYYLSICWSYMSAGPCSPCGGLWISLTSNPLQCPRESKTQHMLVEQMNEGVSEYFLYSPKRTVFKVFIIFLRHYSYFNGFLFVLIFCLFWFFAWSRVAWKQCLSLQWLSWKLSYINCPVNKFTMLISLLWFIYCCEITAYHILVCLSPLTIFTREM